MLESVVPEQRVADVFEFYLDVVGEAHLQSFLPLSAFTWVVLPILIMFDRTKWFDWAEVSWRKN